MYFACPKVKIMGVIQGLLAKIMPQMATSVALSLTACRMYLSLPEPSSAFSGRCSKIYSHQRERVTLVLILPPVSIVAEHIIGTLSLSACLLCVGQEALT